MAYDLIGDVHGHGDALEVLLGKLGYRHTAGAWRHPLGRIAVFVGDLIDRGPRQVNCVRIVRDMIEAGTAQCVAGNHEFAAVKFATVNPWTELHYKIRRANAVRNHTAYLDQVGGIDSPLHREHIEFFLQLPLTIALPGLRVVHACPHPASLAVLATSLTGNAFVDEGGFHRAMADEAVVDAIEKVTSGLEIRLPDGHHFLDAQGQKRRKARAVWWSKKTDLLSDVIEGIEMMPPLTALPAPADATLAPAGLVAFGHYWMAGQHGIPSLTRDTAACLDFSVARGGPLVAYRFDGEPTFSEENFVWVT